MVISFSISRRVNSVKIFMALLFVLLFPVAAFCEEGAKTVSPTGLFGGSALTNPNISLILNTFAYTSSLSESELKSRYITGHIRDGKKGFNLESAELFIFSPVDPYFNLYSTIPISEGEVELEEVYFVTTALPSGFQIKGGKFRSGFGRLNAMHTHAWDFVDSPLPYRALVGKDGLIEKGVQLTYLPDFSFYTLLGAEILQGENELLFGSDAEEGLHAFSSYIKASLDFDDNSTLLFGPSVATGKTKTETGFKGDSTLYGMELTYKWKPSRKQGFLIQGEYLYKRQEGKLNDRTASTDQDGFYLQGLYLSGRWRFGARYDNIGVFKDEFTGLERNFEKNPWRGAGIIGFYPTEFSHIRLQYNYDTSARDRKINHEIMVQFIMGIGAHAAHPF